MLLCLIRHKTSLSVFPKKLEVVGGVFLPEMGILSAGKTVHGKTQLLRPSEIPLDISGAPWGFTLEPPVGTECQPVYMKI